MKRTLSSIFFMMTTLFAFSQSKQEDIKTLISMLNQEAMITEAYAPFFKTLNLQVRNQIKDSVERTAYLDSVKREVMADSKKLIDAYLPKAYDSLFTQDEIKELIKFYKTPAGKKLLANEAELNGMTDSIFRSQLGDMQMKYRRKLKDMREKGNSKLDSIVDAQLKFGPVSDVAVMTLKFSDSATGYGTKMNELLKSKKMIADTTVPGKVYVFNSHEYIKKGKWKITPRFTRDTLSEIRFDLHHTDNMKEEAGINVFDIESLLEKRYGKAAIVDTSSMPNGNGNFRYYWVYGNVKVYLQGIRIVKKQGTIFNINLTFTDTRAEKLMKEKDPMKQ